MFFFVGISLGTDKLEEILQSTMRGRAMFLSGIPKQFINYNFGWSACVGLIAVIAVLVSAIMSMPIWKTSNASKKDETDEDHFLQTIA